MRGIITFDTIEDLEDIIKNLTIEKYNELIPYMENNYELIKKEKYEIPEDWLFEKYPFLFD
jgi:hypothetical protein